MFTRADIIGFVQIAYTRCLQIQALFHATKRQALTAFWLFNLIISQGADFCARIQRKRWKIIRQFYNSGKTEQIIQLPVYPSSVKNCKDMELPLKSLKLRLIRVENFSGKSVLSVYQDFHARIFSKNLTMVKRIEPIRPGRKFPRNFNNKTGIFSYGYKPLR